MVRNNGATDGKIHIVRVEWLVRIANEMLAGEHSLVVEPVRCRPVELIRARLGGEDGLQAGRAAVLYRERVDLHAGFLDGFRLRGQVQHALADSAGHVQPVNDVLVVVLALAVGAGVHLLLGGVIVDSGCGTSGGAGAQARYPGRHGHQRDQVAADDGQFCDTLVIQGQLGTAVGSIDDGRLRRDHDGLGGGAYL